MKTFKSGYVDPETNRVALTAKEFYANGDACDEWLYIYLNDGISYLTDPWRIADGMDAKTGKPIQTEGGSDAKFIAYVPEVEDGKCFICLVYGKIYKFDKDGFGSYELRMKTEKIKIWINIYKDSDSYWYFSPEDAAAGVAHDDGYITTVESEIEV